MKASDLEDLAEMTDWIISEQIQCTREDDWENEEDWNEDDGDYHPCHDREEVDRSSWPGKHTEWPLANYRVMFTFKIVREVVTKNAEKTETSEANFDIISAPLRLPTAPTALARPDNAVSRPMTEVDYTTWGLSANTRYRVLH